MGLCKYDCDSHSSSISLCNPNNHCQLVLKIVTSQDSHHKFRSDEKLTIGKVMLNHDGMYYVPCVTHLNDYSCISKPLCVTHDLDSPKDEPWNLFILIFYFYFL